MCRAERLFRVRGRQQQSLASIRLSRRLGTFMPKLQVTFFRHRTRPGVFAVSPVSTNLVFFEPDDWELDRQEVIAPDRISPDSDIAVWLESFRRLGYCVLEPA